MQCVSITCFVKTEPNCTRGLFFFSGLPEVGGKKNLFSFIIFNHLQAKTKLNTAIINVKTKAYRKDIETCNKFKNKEKIKLKFAA